ncbi:MAG: hypothetical protein ACRENB_16405 [Gemmatimonadales bacterium]
MAKHPTVIVPNIGPVDHAWDLLGEWRIAFERMETGRPRRARLLCWSWDSMELELEPADAAIEGVPRWIELRRTSKVHRTDAGGGALQWVLMAPRCSWAVQATLWPGELLLFFQDADDTQTQIYQAIGGRSKDYYLRKYPLEKTSEERR